MKEQDLVDLGFERVDETAESSGAPNDWYYYTLDIGINEYNKFGLISNANDEIKDNNWKVYLLENDSFVFEDRATLELLINTLKYNMIKNG